MPSSSVSSSSSTGALPSPSADAAATAPVSMSSIPMVDSLTPFDQSADVGQEFGHGDPAMFSAQAGGDGDSDTSFWDIIADSHMKLESYGDMPFDQEMTEPVASLLSPVNSLSSNSLAPSPVSATNLPGFEDRLTNGFCEALSKPIVREDGFLLVGTELVPDSLAPTGEKNRIFVKNFLVSSGAGVQQPRDHIPVDQEVRDMQWMGSQAAVLAIGKDIQIVQLGDLSIGGPCRLQAPINAVHADTIREVAVSPTKTSYVVSGGFDGTVVLTDLRNHGDPQAASIIGKYNASDVVSSVRWAPSIPHLSWTTDGGDFQVADTRVQSPQLQIPLYTSQNLTALGGLYTHEYLSSFNIALGFEHGHIAFVDIRMPRQNCCTSTIESKLTGTGEMRRSPLDKIAIFGSGGFSTANINATTTSLENIIVQQQHTPASYKTSGDFSPERGLYLAVSDSLGVVSVYSDDDLFGSSIPFSGSTPGW